MSMRYLGGVITANSVTPTGSYQDSAAPGVWTTAQQLQLKAAGLWPLFGNANPDSFIENLFSTYLYTGNSSTQTINNGIDLAGEGGLVWIKDRAGPYTYGHFLFDTNRGVNKYLRSEQTSAQGTLTNALNSFNASGFSLGSNGNVNDGAPITYASWTLRKQPKFFDIQTFTTTYNVNPNVISHNLGGELGCAIFKQLNSTGQGINWIVYHRSLGTGKYLRLNLSGATVTDAQSFVAVNNTAGTISFGYPMSDVNDRLVSGGTETTNWVGYFFAHNAGGFGLSGNENVISCGSFTTDAYLSVITTNLGYEPQWIMMKSTQDDNWIMIDNMRGMTTGIDAILNPNLSSAENTDYQGISPTATGFTVTSGSGVSTYATYIYIAIRRGPMAVPTLGTTVFEPSIYTGNDAYPTTVGSLPVVDLAMPRGRGGSGAPRTIDRLRGGSAYLFTSSTSAETSISPSYVVNFDNQSGLKIASQINSSGTNYVNYSFRRAPSYMDVVCYTGTGVARTVAHNLAAVPELIIVKQRNTAQDWLVYAAPIGNTNALYLNFNDASTTRTEWNSTTPTTSVFSLSTDISVNQSSGTYVAYLFATCPGVSKVGSYTGTGTTQAINCGFTAGARYVLIKRTDSTGDWYVWDSARGIVAGNDPYLLLNSTAAEVTGTDYIDTSATGFEISSTAPAAINANGGSYIFLAIS